jgi:hypothetical protein
MRQAGFEPHNQMLQPAVAVRAVDRVTIGFRYVRVLWLKKSGGGNVNWI